MTLLPDNLLPSPADGLAPGQAEAIEAARELTVPTTEAEDWRYSRIDDLFLDELHPARPPAAPHAPVAPADRLASALNGAAAELVLSAGQPTRRQSHSEDVGLDTAKVALTAGDDDQFTVLNTALSPEPQQITVRARAQVSKPIVVVDAAGGEGELAAPRLQIDVGDHASVTVVHLVWSDPGHSVVVPVTELAVGDGAQVAVVTIHALASGTWALGRVVAEVGRDARLGLNTFGTGGHYSRVSVDATLAGPGSTLDNRGLYFGTGAQMHDFRVRQRHIGHHTTSKYVLRGAVRDRAEGVFTGVVRMERGARNADGAQDAKHLVLEDGAHVDSVPNLEIEENQVVCAHASSIGPVDADQVFYLESRGVPTLQAIRLIARGFLREGQAGIGPPALADAVGALVAEQLAPELAAPLVR